MLGGSGFGSKARGGAEGVSAMQQPVITARKQEGRLYNAIHELLARGECDVTVDGITMRVEAEHVAKPHRTAHGLTLVLDDDKAIEVSNRFVRLQLRGGEGPPTTIYRMRRI